MSDSNKTKKKKKVMKLTFRFTPDHEIPGLWNVSVIDRESGEVLATFISDSTDPDDWLARS